MLILCGACIDRMRKRGEEVTEHYGDGEPDSFAVCDICGSSGLLSEVAFPEDKYFSGE